MTAYAELVTFAVRWLPFGGPPAEDVFVTFGLTVALFRERLAEAMTHERSRIAPATVRALLETYRL